MVVVVVGGGGGVGGGVESRGGGGGWPKKWPEGTKKLGRNSHAAGEGK